MKSTHDLRRGLHSFAASRLGYLAAMVESHGGVRWDGETITKWWRERRPLGLKPVWACFGTRPWKGRSSTVVCGAVVRGWCMRQLGTRRFLRTGWDSFAPSELDFFAAFFRRFPTYDSKTHLPPTMVRSIAILFRFIGSALNGSSARTMRSASLPGSSDPLVFSSKVE